MSLEDPLQGQKEAHISWIEHQKTILILHLGKYKTHAHKQLTYINIVTLVIITKKIISKRFSYIFL